MLNTSIDLSEKKTGLSKNNYRNEQNMCWNAHPDDSITIDWREDEKHEE